MFTGIVEELGSVTGREDRPDAARLVIDGPLVTSDARHGDSIAVNGVCLTVVAIEGTSFTADVIGETLRRSGLDAARPGGRVNLERATKLGDRLGGHLVQGHVDGTGTLLERTAPTPDAPWELIRVGLAPTLGRYLVEKGSITVDGVSLTVVEVGDDWFSIGLIPTTREVTTLGFHEVGATVNLEVDIIAKYIERLATPHLAVRPGADR